MAGSRKRASSASESTPDTSVAPNDSPEPPPKRTRTNATIDFDAIEIEGDEGFVPEAMPEVQDSDNDDVEMEVNEDEDKTVTRGAKRLATQIANNGRESVIAEAGIIESLEIKNFMSHEHLLIEFGEQVNFITGVNGSGKSAILTALTIGLGGSASLTDRAKNIASFVRRDAPDQRADIIIHIKNQGPDAYKHAVYGDSIRVERYFTVANTNGYKIKSISGQTISLKKSDLQSILDHFCIQVDNPISILSQDEAKRFISAATPKQKYESFLSGTMLRSLAIEYDEIMNTIRAARMHLNRNNSALPELQEADRIARSKFKAAEAIETSDAKLAELKKTLAWSYVVNAEAKVTDATDELQAEEDAVPELREKVQTEQDAVDAANEKIREAEQAVVDFEANDDGDNERDNELQNLLKGKRDNLKDIKKQQREMNDNLQEAKRLAADFARRIEAENRKLAEADGGQRDRNLAQIAALEKEVADLTAAVEAAKADHIAAQQEREDRSPDLEQARRAIADAEGDVNARQAELQNVQRARGNPMAVYGQQINAVVSAIERSKFQWDVKPLGPLGRHVKLLEPEWSAIVESAFNTSLNTFVVFSERDRRQLTDIMRQCKCTSADIMRRRDDRNFRFESGMPDRQFKTMLDVLQIDDDRVRNALIDDSKIESTILIEDHMQAIHVMRGNPRNVTGCYSMRGYRISRGANESTYMQDWRGAPRLVADMTQHIARAEQELQRAQSAMQTAKQSKQELDAALTAIEHRRSTADREIQRRKPAINSRNEQAAKLRETLSNAAPVNVSHLEEGKRNAEDEMESIKAQFADVSSASQKIMEEMKPLTEEREAIDERSTTRTAEKKRLGGIAVAAAESRIKASHDLKHWQDALTRRQRQVTVKQTELAAITTTLQGLMETAAVVCPREEAGAADKSPNAYVREIESIKKAQQKRIDEVGGTPAELRERMIKARDELSGAMKMMKDYDSFLDALKVAHQKRVDRWDKFLQNIAIRSRMYFAHNLNNRNFSGSLRYNHERRILDVRVTPSADMMQGPATRDSKSLSGGEKSFSTICLLLALWDCLSCPLRCLDEFDVFMDDVNRKVSIKLLMACATAAQGRQHIFITPQSIRNVRLDDNEAIKIVRLEDPERASGLLAANRI